MNTENYYVLLLFHPSSVASRMKMYTFRDIGEPHDSSTWFIKSCTQVALHSLIDFPQGSHKWPKKLHVLSKL